jgi:hypothetical protein
MAANQRAGAELLDQFAREIHSDTALRFLTPVQWPILRFLSKATASGRTIHHVAVYLGVSEIITRQAVSALHRKTLVTFSRTGEVAQIALTGEGT